MVQCSTGIDCELGPDIIPTLCRGAAGPFPLAETDRLRAAPEEPRTAGEWRLGHRDVWDLPPPPSCIGSKRAPRPYRGGGRPHPQLIDFDWFPALESYSVICWWRRAVERSGIMPGTFVDVEIASQPELWQRASTLLPEVENRLPRSGRHVAVVGCGTSWFVAQSYAALREARGSGITDAFTASEYPTGRSYDGVVAISRSGTTTEIIDLLQSLSEIPTLLITGVHDSPAASLADETIVLSFADEQSVVQTRFATSTLALLRAHLGEDIASVAQDGRRALEIDPSTHLDAEQVTFLGRGWSVGLAAEAALKAREAAQFWAESYPAMDYRHGPFAIAQPGRLVWALGEVPAGLAAEVSGTGATFVHHELDPMAGLVVAQRYAVALAKRRGLDPDHPRALTRSVVLTED